MSSDNTATIKFDPENTRYGVLNLKNHGLCVVITVGDEGVAIPVPLWANVLDDLDDTLAEIFDGEGAPEINHPTGERLH